VLYTRALSFCLVSPRLCSPSVLSSVKNLKNVLSACCNITSQGGTSSPKASRSRKRLLTHPSPPLISFPPPGILPTHPDISRRYNPVLGEFFRCRYDYPNSTQGFYIAEQGTSSRFRPSHPDTRHAFFISLRPPIQSRIIHLYPPSTTFHQRTRLPSSASSDQSPNFSATPSRRRWRVRAELHSWVAQRTPVNCATTSPLSSSRVLTHPPQSTC